MDFEQIYARAESECSYLNDGDGRTAPNPVLRSIMLFGKDYDAHIKDRRCPLIRQTASEEFGFGRY
jgi:hypothetical protein